MTDNNALAQELEPCPVPWCGSTDARIERFVCLHKPGQHQDRAIVCRTCGLATHVFCTEAEAISAWNTRTPAPAPVGGDVATREAKIAEWVTGAIARAESDESSVPSSSLDLSADDWRIVRAALQSPPAPEQDAVERVAKAICKAAITHEVVGDVPQGQLNRMVENLTIKYFPEARAALAAMPPKVEAPAADEVRELVERLRSLGLAVPSEYVRLAGKAVREAADMLERLSHPTADAVAVERWQPIETCESTGEAEAVIVAVICPDRETIVGEAWRTEDGEWWWAGTAPGDYYDSPIHEINFGEVTHWMPMPDAPVAIGSGGAS